MRFSTSATPRASPTSAGSRLLERMREEAGGDLPLGAFKTMVRDQFFTLLLDERRAVEAIPAMLDTDPNLAARMGSTLRKLIEVLGVESKLGKSRLAEMTAMFKSRKAAKAPKNGAPKADRPQPARPARHGSEAASATFTQFELRRAAARPRTAPILAASRL